MYNNDIDDDELDDICMIDYGYSITVHKSQGSEYNNVGVFVDFPWKPDEYNKWLYIAITRKQSVTIISIVLSIISQINSTYGHNAR